MGTIGMVAVGFAIYIFGFAVGKDYAKRDCEEYIEGKRKELYAYRDELLRIEAELEKKDELIRQKWQNMVSDFANYQAYTEPGTTGKWTEWDDIYLNSWGSAEK